MPDLRAFLGSGRAGIEQRYTSPCLGDYKGHIGPVNALPDSASELMVILLGKARAEPAQQLYHFNLGDTRAKPGTDTFQSLGETEAEPALKSHPLGCKEKNEVKP